MKRMCNVCKIVGLFAIVGALNWGLVGIFNINVVSRVLGDMSVASRVVYALVGISGLMLALSYVKVCPACQKKG